MTAATRHQLIRLLAADLTIPGDIIEKAVTLLERKGQPLRGIIKFQEAAERLGVTKETVKRLVNAGQLDGVKGAGIRLLGVTTASFNRYCRMSDFEKANGEVELCS